MTELHIERRERTAWPWVLGGLLLLALLLWFLFGRGDATERQVTDATPATVLDSAPTAPASAAATDADGLPAAVAAFVRHADEGASGAMSHTHDYTADGLRRLADALGAVTEESSVSGVDVPQRLDGIRQQADALQRDPTSTEHARQAREGFLLAAGLMRQLQDARFTGLATEIGAVNDAATAVRADRMLLEQGSEVQRFFDRAADAVRAMARAG